MVAEKLQILDESEASDMQLGDEVSRSMKKRKVVSNLNKVSSFCHQLETCWQDIKTVIVQFCNICMIITTYQKL
jgi:hypothetical protein